MASSLTLCLDRGVWTRTMCLQRAANTPACLCWQLLPLVFLWIEVCMKKKKKNPSTALPSRWSFQFPNKSDVLLVLLIAESAGSPWLLWSRLNYPSGSWIAVLVGGRLSKQLSWNAKRFPEFFGFICLFFFFISSRPIWCAATSSARSFRPTTWVLGSFSCALRPGG